MFATRLMLTVSALSALAFSYHPATAQTPPPGKAAYDRVCRVCHGEDGRGDAGPRLVPFEHDIDQVLAIVREGTGQMPPIADTRVSDDELKSIVEYLTSLSVTKVQRH